VRPEGVSKGALLRKILDKLRDQGRSADFVLVLGDDPSDEDLFTAAEEYAGNKECSLIPPFNALSPVAMMH